MRNDRVERSAVEAADQRAKFEEILSRWHSWMRSYQANQQMPKDPTFREVKSGRGWDTTDEIIEDEVTSDQMEAVEFEVSEMKEPCKSAIYELARNLSTGRNVWISPRLPKEPLERQAIVHEARCILMRRLYACGVM